MLDAIDGMDNNKKTSGVHFTGSSFNVYFDVKCFLKFNRCETLAAEQLL